MALPVVLPPSPPPPLLPSVRQLPILPPGRGKRRQVEQVVVQEVPRGWRGLRGVAEAFHEGLVQRELRDHLEEGRHRRDESRRRICKGGRTQEARSE